MFSRIVYVLVGFCQPDHKLGSPRGNSELSRITVIRLASGHVWKAQLTVVLDHIRKQAEQSCVAYFYANLAQARVIWEEGNAPEKTPPVIDLWGSITAFFFFFFFLDW